MTKNVCYTASSKMEEKIRIRHLIPYSVNSSTKYKVGSLYYSDYWDAYFKVLSAKYNKNILDYIYVKWEDGNYGYYCTDLTTEDLLLKHDSENIFKSRVINTGIPYYGAEIIYWFYMNEITSYNKTYFGFWKYIDRYSDCKLEDDKLYYASGEFDNKTGKFNNCKMILAK